MTGTLLSVGQQLLLKGLRHRPRLKGKLGPLASVIPRLEERGLVRSFAPGKSPMRTMVEITAAGLAAIPTKEPADG